MKFIHIADLHLGKIIYQQNLLSLQEDLLNQVLLHMQEQAIDTLVIAGDVYDRSVPSGEAIDVLNRFLYRVIIENNKKVLLISGNHDSSERLNFASDLLKKQGLHIISYPEKIMEPVVIEGINFYLLPFFKPSYIRYLYQETTITTYQQAMEYYLQQQKIDTTKTNVLITHQFIAGNKEVITSESEVMLSVGGTEIIDVDVFKDFDYVALGHLHASQKVKRETIRYSGSLMKYSFDEVKQKKGMCEVTINGKEVLVKAIPLQPKQDLQQYQGSFSEFMNHQTVIDKSDFLSFVLTDTKIVPNAIDQLRTIYPNVLQITYPNVYTSNNQRITKADTGFEKKDTLSLFTEFYEKMKDIPLDDESKQILNQIIQEEEKNVT